MEKSIEDLVNARSIREKWVVVGKNMLGFWCGGAFANFIDADQAAREKLRWETAMIHPDNRGTWTVEENPLSP